MGLSVESTTVKKLAEIEAETAKYLGEAFVIEDFRSFMIMNMIFGMAFMVLINLGLGALGGYLGTRIPVSKKKKK